MKRSISQFLIIDNIIDAVNVQYLLRMIYICQVLFLHRQLNGDACEFERMLLRIILIATRNPTSNL